MKIRLFGVLWRLDEEQDTAQPDLCLLYTSDAADE